MIAEEQAGDGLGMARLRYCLRPPEGRGRGREQNRACSV